MTWTTGISDLRNALSDGPTDRYRYEMQVFGTINGVNPVFKTFELRRVTDFTVTQGIYKNGNLLATNAVASDDPTTGQFTLVSGSIPVDGDSLTASYYLQWFLDSELTQFLTRASQWLSMGDDYTQVQGPLIPGALLYAQSQAYLKMAQRWRDYLSSGYRVEDSPQKSGSGLVSEYIKMAEAFRQQAEKDRDAFYTRAGQALSPLFGVSSGTVRSMP